MKLLVLNLDRTTTSEELNVLFADFGTVQSCNIVVDKENNESKGFGFVEMPKPIEAKAAIHNLNNRKFGRNRIRVKKAEAKNPE